MKLMNHIEGEMMVNSQLLKEEAKHLDDLEELIPLYYRKPFDDGLSSTDIRITKMKEIYSEKFPARSLEQLLTQYWCKNYYKRCE